MIKKVVAIILGVSMAIVPIISCANTYAGYLFLKAIMEMEIVEGVAIPTGREVQIENDILDKYFCAVISMTDNWIAIGSGKDENNNRSSRIYTDLSERQLCAYAMSILLMFEDIDTLSSGSFYVLMKYGTDNDDISIITDAETAMEMHAILKEYAKTI